MASIFDVQQISPEDEEERLLDYARLTPAQRSVLNERRMQQRGTRSFKAATRAALGLPEIPDAQANRQAAAQELRALAAKVRPGTAEFYDAAIPILQKHGLPEEAGKMEESRRALADSQRELETGKAELSPAVKLMRAKDLLAKRPDASGPEVQAAVAAIDREMAALGTKPGAAANDPEFIKLLNSYEAALKGGNEPRAALIQKALDAWLQRAQNKGEDTARYRDAMLALRKREVDMKIAEKTAKKDAADRAVVKSIQALVRAIDEDLSSATRLLAHPGLDFIIGPRAGVDIAESAVAMVSGPMAGAMALYKQVRGQTFIRALQDLKATSSTGASGLGQLTEIEGDKIQNAKVAISRQQPPAQFRRTIQGYLNLLNTGRAVAAQELSSAGETVPVAPPIISDRPTKLDPRTVATPTATPAPAQKSPKFRAIRVK
jgi:hypothetical protein